MITGDAVPAEQLDVVSSGTASQQSGQPALLAGRQRYLHVVMSDLSAFHADVQSLQQANGSFAGDDWGEIDTR